MMSDTNGVTPMKVWLVIKEDWDGKSVFAVCSSEEAANRIVAEEVKKENIRVNAGCVQFWVGDEFEIRR